MNETFRQQVEELHPAYQRLVAAVPCRYADLPRQSMRQQGVYLLTRHSRHPYVGRSDNIRKRLGVHCNVSRTRTRLR